MENDFEAFLNGSDEWISDFRLAGYLDVSAATVRKYGMPEFKLGRKVVYRKSDVLRAMGVKAPLT